MESSVPDWSRPKPAAVRVPRGHRPWLALLLLSTMGTICRSPTNPGIGSSESSVAVWNSGSGTFSGTESSGAEVLATLSAAEVYLSAVPIGEGVQTFLVVSAELGGDNGTEDLEFASPGGILEGTFAVNITLDGAPTPGTYTEQSSSATGGVALAYSTASAGEGFSATAASGATQARGSWTLLLTSAVVADGGVGPQPSAVYEIAHGTLAADLTDGLGGTGTLQLTF